MWFADGEEFDHQALARLQVYADFFALLHAEEKLWGGQDLDITPNLLRLCELDENVRVHQVAQHLILRGTTADFLFNRQGGFFEIHRCEPRTRTAAVR